MARVTEAGGTGGLPGTKVRRIVNTVEAGSSLIVQCLASGEPAPDLSININRVTMHTDKEALVMNPLIHNITRDVKTGTRPSWPGPTSKEKFIRIRKYYLFSTNEAALK